MSGTANYRSIPALLAARTPFDGNSMKGRLAGAPMKVRIGDHGDTVELEAGDYIVFSYTTVIAVKFSGTGEKIVTSETWGNTTARHKNLCHAWL